MIEIAKETWNKCKHETNIKVELKHSHLAAVTLQYSSGLRKQRKELQDCGNFQPCRRLSNTNNNGL